MHIDESGIGSMPVSPNLVQQHFAGEDLPWSTSQTRQQIEFEGRQRDHVVTATNNVTGDVDFEVTDREMFDERLRCRTKTCAEPSDKFLRLERLVDVVIRAVLESGDNIECVRARSEHHDRDAGFRANTAAYFNAVTTRQHHIEQHDVRFAVTEYRKRKITIGAKDRLKSFGAQDDSQHLGQCCVIIDYKNPIGHGHILSLRPRPRHAGGKMTDAPIPMRLGVMSAHTYQFMRANFAATVGIGALLATLDATISGVANSLAGDAARSLGDVLSAQQDADITAAQVAAALPWISLSLLISFLTQLAATGIMTVAVVRARRSESVQPAVLWQSVPWPRLFGLNVAILGLILLAALGPILLVLFVNSLLFAAIGIVIVTTIAIAIGASLAVPALINEQLGIVAALKRSLALVRRRWLRVAWLIIAANLLWGVIGTIISAPISGLLSLLAGGAGSAFGQALQAITSAIITGGIALPGISIMTTLIYFARVADQ